MQRLEESRYTDKRERERERCVSAADTSTYGPMRARGDTHHTCPQRTHAKTIPHHRDPAPPQQNPLQKRLTSIPENRPKPDLSTPSPPRREAMTNMNITRPTLLVKSELQTAQETGPQRATFGSRKRKTRRSSPPPGHHRREKLRAGLRPPDGVGSADAARPTFGRRDICSGVVPRISAATSQKLPNSG
jgi:hypothetical protein